LYFKSIAYADNLDVKYVCLTFSFSTTITAE